MNDIPSDDRCRAIVQYIHNWRCLRRAGSSGLCSQHFYFGATVPDRWGHPVNQHGVTTCEPLGARRRMTGARGVVVETQP